MNYYLSEGSLSNLRFKELGRFKLGGTKIAGLDKLTDDVNKYTYLCWVITNNKDASVLDYSYGSSPGVMNGICFTVSEFLTMSPFETIWRTEEGTKKTATIQWTGWTGYTDIIYSGTKGYYGILYGI